MRAASVLLIVGSCALSASIPHSTFRYQLQTSFRRNEDSCRLCYGDDCISMAKARCQYYADADDVLNKDEDDGEVTEVDEMIYDLTEQAATSWTVQPCVPLISRYTDCSKDNVCIGCKVCTCTSAGEWDCKNEPRCRPDPIINVDHRTLVMVMEKLLEREKTTRRKRAVSNETDKVQVSYVDIADWMYRVKPSAIDDFPFSDVETDNFVKALVDQEPFQIQTQSKILGKKTESENIDFEEVLKNIAVDDQSNKRRKSRLKNKNNTVYYYMDLEDNRVISSNASDQFINVLNEIEEGKEVTDSVDTIINLLPRSYFNDDINATNNMANNIVNEEDKIPTDANDIIGFDAVNVMKRDVFSVTSMNHTTQATSTPNATFETTTIKENNVENNVLIPLTTIINDKVDEIKQLMQIRENLVRFMKTHNESDVNITSRPEIINSSQTFFSIYTLDLYPEIQENLRKTNRNVLEKLIYKLKRDIYEVLRDINRIQKVSRTGLPADLKVLVRSIKYYVHEQGNFRNLNNKDNKSEKNKYTRRLWASPTSVVTDTSNSIKSQLLDILETIDRNKQLIHVSKSAKKIIKHVIKQNFIDEFSNVGLRVNDPSYNLTNDLKNIGKNWPQLTAYVANSPQHDKLYALKLLHFNLAGDINRIIDALALVNFAHNRRMTPLETPAAAELMDRVNDGLLIIKNKIKLLLKYHANSKKAHAKVVKKQSFFNKLRNLLRNSRSEVIEMVNKKVPKSEIVRKIAEKKLDELTLKKMTEYEQTMLKWQRNLKMGPRKKRDLASKLKNMKHNLIKNIIPKYLRGKINPALVKKENHNKHSGTKKKETRKSKTLAISTITS